MALHLVMGAITTLPEKKNNKKKVVNLSFPEGQIRHDTKCLNSRNPTINFLDQTAPTPFIITEYFFEKKNAIIV